MSPGKIPERDSVQYYFRIEEPQVPKTIDGFFSFRQLAKGTINAERKPQEKKSPEFRVKNKKREGGENNGQPLREKPGS
jgi:hypothetical protein